MIADTDKKTTPPISCQASILKEEMLSLLHVAEGDSAGKTSGQIAESDLQSASLRRRQEAIKRLFDSVVTRPNQNEYETLSGTMYGMEGGASSIPGVEASSAANNSSSTVGTTTTNAVAEELHLASTVATAIEKGLDRELHAEFVRGERELSRAIASICNQHSDAFLSSVGRVVALGAPCLQLRGKLEQLNAELQKGTMLKAAQTLERTRMAHVRARTVSLIVVGSCKRVAGLLEHARKQAALGRPRLALDAVDEARVVLTTPIVIPTVATGGTKPLYLGIGDNKHSSAPNAPNASGQASSDSAMDNGFSSAEDAANPQQPPGISQPRQITITLEETPFGARAMEMLPKIENEVMMGARRSLNRWFLLIRSGDGAAAGAAALRKCAHGVSIGAAGLGGDTQSYNWRATNAQNLIERIIVRCKVAQACKLAYDVNRDSFRDVSRLDLVPQGLGRRAEAVACAFGWYRCWDEHASIGVELFEGASGGGTVGQNRSASGGFTTFRGSAQTQAKSLVGSSKSQWTNALIPAILFEDAPTKEEDYLKLLGLSEAVFPVRRAESAFALLGRVDEFRTYYEQNRFGEMSISGTSKSSLSSLTGDDVSHGTDRVFFAKTLPHLAASVVGFSAVEAALEMGNFSDSGGNAAGKLSGNIDEDQSTSVKTVAAAVGGATPSSKYERCLIAELGTLIHTRMNGATLTELARSSLLMVSLRSALRLVFPSSPTRRSDKDLIAFDADIIMYGVKIAQEEQLKATSKLAKEERYESLSRMGMSRDTYSEEVVNFPFGLYDSIQTSSFGCNINTETLDIAPRRGRASTTGSGTENIFTFSHSVLPIVRSIHARVISFAAFALGQQEIGQNFSGKKGGLAAYVLDCMDECVSVAAKAMKSGFDHMDELQVEQAIQILANITALQNTLPRFYGTIMRGLCHVGLVRAENLDDSFQYADSMLERSRKACDSDIGAMYSVVYEITRSKLDTLIDFSLENFQWISRHTRDTPNAYVESLIEYMRSTFSCLAPMDEGSRTGLHFSACGHVAERLVRLLTDPPESKSTSSLPPISKIDAFGLKNLALDVQEFEKFADNTGVPQLGECFNELKCLTEAMIDRDLPLLLTPGNDSVRRRKYPLLSLEKVVNILEKYNGLGLGEKLKTVSGAKSKKGNDLLMLEKKEVLALIRLIKAQTGSMSA